eukprot:MONOS_5556.1-p1 / transcript=MONOS_5556.1 / gene=MONOS_5556 / organism=Monocercomonoides_exilis_PA203 / gene_product=unspecified product / transcript_product=unspecified product / location=Mono_scaffold00163:41320-42453(-) / protein_length=378 / sequence_SO=supercontig / SO=protein_coding / is_pseudo=false
MWSSKTYATDTIKDSDFSYCFTNDVGGILSTGSPGEMSVVGCSFNYCCATGGGADSLSTQNTMRINSLQTLSSFAMRPILSTPEASRSKGGAIFCSSTSMQLTVNNSVFERCSATVSGGAIDLRCSAQLTYTNVSWCSAGWGGGIAVWHSQDSHKLSFSDSCVYGNNGSSFGGGLLFHNVMDELLFQSVNFLQNIAGFRGGAIYFGGNVSSSLLSRMNKAKDTAIKFESLMFEGNRIELPNGAYTRGNENLGTSIYAEGSNSGYVRAIKCKSFLRCSGNDGMYSFVIGNERFPSEWFNGECILTDSQTVAVIVPTVVIFFGTLLTVCICMCCRQRKKTKLALEGERLTLLDLERQRQEQFLLSQQHQRQTQELAVDV